MCVFVRICKFKNFEQKSYFKKNVIVIAIAQNVPLYGQTLIRSIPGIGLITGMIFLTEIEDIARFENSDKLAGFIGLTPTCHSSGERESKGEITPRRHNSMRKTLVESSWIAVRRDPALSLSFSKYCKRMEPNKAITRIARKLVNRVFFVLTNEKKYEYKIV